MNVHFKEAAYSVGGSTKPRFAQGDVVAYFAPGTHERQLAVVLSSNETNAHNPDYLLLCHLDQNGCGWSVATRRGIAHADKMFRVGVDYWRVQKYRNWAVEPAELRRIIDNFSRFVSPHEKNNAAAQSHEEHKRGTIAYGDIRWYDLPYEQKKGIEPHPVLCISSPDRDGLFLALRTSSRTYKFHPLYSHLRAKGGLVNCVDLYVLQQADARQFVERIPSESMAAIAEKTLSAMDHRVFNQIREIHRDEIRNLGQVRATLADYAFK